MVLFLKNSQFIRNTCIFNIKDRDLDGFTKPIRKYLITITSTEDFHPMITKGLFVPPTTPPEVRVISFLVCPPPHLTPPELSGTRQITWGLYTPILKSFVPTCLSHVQEKFDTIQNI